MELANDLQNWLKKYRSGEKREYSLGERYKSEYGTLWYKNGWWSADWYYKDDDGVRHRARRKLSTNKETAIKMLRDIKQGKVDEKLSGQASTRVGVWGELMTGAELIRMGWEIFYSPFINNHTCDIVALKGEVILKVEVKTNNQLEQHVGGSVYKSKADVFAFVTKQNGVVFNLPMERI